MNIDIFSNLLDYKKYFADQLVLSSTFLGLLIATSTFLLQSGFSSFEHSRIMFLKYYVRLTKFLFLLLGYNIVLSSIFIYTNLNQCIIYIIHIFFIIIFTKYFLDFYSYKGYLVTINSNKINPFKNQLRIYFRYIKNAGLIQNFIIVILLGIIVIYPLLLGRIGEFSEKQGFVSTVISFSFCVIALIRIIPTYFAISEQEYKYRENNELTKEIDVDITQELEILKDILIKKKDRSELVSTVSFKPLNGKIRNSLHPKENEAFFVIDIWTEESDVEKIVRAIESYSQNFFEDLKNIDVDINSFVLSFYIKISGTDTRKTYFIRAKRIELESLFLKKLNSKDFIKSIEIKVIDPLFRNM